MRQGQVVKDHQLPRPQGDVDCYLLDVQTMAPEERYPQARIEPERLKHL